jgi:hypothetical protein
MRLAMRQALKALWMRPPLSLILRAAQASSRIDNPHGSWFCKAVGALSRPDQAYAVQLVENDDQNASPAENRDERLNPRSRISPAGRRVHEVRARRA